MPFKSKAQQRFMFAAEERGDIPKGTAREWAHKTKNIKKLPEHVKKSSAEMAEEVVKKTAQFESIREAALATDWKASTALRDIFNGGKWAPGGVEYQGSLKIAAELPTNVLSRAPSAIGSVIGAPKPKAPKLPAIKPPKPPKTKKTAAEIATHVIKKLSLT